MDLYHVWCDLKPGVRDTDFAMALSGWMDHLKDRNMIEGYRLTRRKLGLGPREIGEFHIIIEVRDLAQLDEAFKQASARAGEAEQRHFDVNSLVQNLTFGLYRDFPDSHRQTGEEKF